MNDRRRAVTVRLWQTITFLSAAALVVSVLLADVDLPSLVRVGLAGLGAVGALASFIAGVKLRRPGIIAASAAQLVLVALVLLAVVTYFGMDPEQYRPSDPSVDLAHLPVPESFPKAPFDLPRPEPIGPEPRDGLLPAEYLSQIAVGRLLDGEIEEAVPYASHALAKGGDGVDYYNCVCALARGGHVKAAVYHLQEAALVDGVDSAHAARDPDLESIRASKYWPDLHRFLQLAQVYWMNSDAKRVVVVVPPELEGKERVPALVWLHGMGANPDALTIEMAGLGADLGFAVVGISATRPNGPKSFTWTEEHAVDRQHVTRALKEAAAENGVTFDPIVLIGFSQGAALAANLALTDRWVRGALIFSPGQMRDPEVLEPKPKPRPTPAYAAVVYAEHESYSTVRRSKAAAAALEEINFTVELSETQGQESHAFPPDFEERFPEWWAKASGLGQRNSISNSSE